MAAYLLSFVDRQMLPLLVGPVQASLQIGDTQFSLLTGFAFSVFFALSGVPLGRMADRYPRNAVIGIGILIWCAATAACGLAASFGELFAARMFVGIGEAALTPAAYSLFADIFSRGRLGRAIGVFSLGSLFGSAVALLGGSALLEWLQSTPSLPRIRGEAWPVAFLIVAAPGLVLAPLVLWTAHDPRKGSKPATLSFADLRGLLWERRRWLIAHAAGFTALAAPFFGLMAWLPALLARRFDETAVEAGRHAGILVLLASPLGTLAAAWTIDYLTRRGRQDAPILVGLGWSVGLLPALALVGIAPPGPALNACLLVALFFAPCPLVAATTALQRAVPETARAQTTALFLLIVNLFGQTPTVTAIGFGAEHLLGDPRLIHLSFAAVLTVAVLLSLAPLAAAARMSRAENPGPSS